MPRRLLLAPAALAAIGAADPPAVVTSPAPDRVALTVYRAPNGRGAIDLHWLGGFALVTETRRVQLPRGTALIRFEGVAEGIVPVSAVVEGLPGGVVEKNRDARLLSPASLVDGTLGGEVTLTRTDKATGRATSEEATIVAGSSPGVILRTASGIETLRCSGLAERLSYHGVPAGLSSKPVLSVTTTSPSAQTATVRLSYLASGFDWRASYVATLAPDGRAIGLFAWLTLANGNAEAFADAEVRAVAGRLNRKAAQAIPAAAAALRLTCYPLGTTTSGLIPTRFKLADAIVVTASRRGAGMAMMMAMPAPLAPIPPPPPPPEDVGDLKLYRVPGRTTVAPRAQKQVALLAQPSVPFERRYRLRVGAGQQLDAAPTAIVLVVKNTGEAGMGVPLPAGGTALYANSGGRRLLLGLGAMTDRAVGETVRLAAGTSRQVLVAQKPVSPHEATLTVTNANPFAVTLDAPIGAPGQKIDAIGEVIPRVDGIATWSPVLSPGGQATLTYRY